MPHGHCYLWQPDLLWTIVVCDILIGISYGVISAALLYLVRKIRISFSGTFVAFGLFIAACGAGHFYDIITVWRPLYWGTAAIRVITAVASVATAVWIFPLIPRVLNAFSQVEEARKQELKLKQYAEELVRINQLREKEAAELEIRVRERTEELSASGQLLIASQREYQELVNTVDGIVWEAVVGKPRFTFVSRQAERVLGYPVERWLNEVGFWQNILHPEDRVRMTGDGYLTPAEKRDARLEYRVITADGRTLWVRDHVKVILEDGRPSKMRGIMMDITDQKRVEDELRRTQDVAVRASTVKSEFLANMSHEIRTPLNAIIGMSTIGLDSSAEEQKECLATIKTAGDSLLALISEILDFSKMEAGKVELEVSDFELVSVPKNALEVISPLAKSKEIEVCFQADPTLPVWVTGDSGRILQILLNLMGNAVKFTPNGGKVALGVKRVAYRSEASSCWVRFEVADTGQGIAEEAKTRLFQPFVQADNSTARKHGGTGLGLSICKRLVEFMQGRIGMDSELGKGSTFWFEIPMSSASSREMAVDAPAVAPAASRKARSARILIAEDNPANQKVIHRFLEKLGHRAEIVADGREALSAFEAGGFDLVFMDCQMPEMDGYEATRRIRELEHKLKKTTTPIIALTAHAMSGDESKCREAGMNDYLCKPVSPKKLEETINAWITESDAAAVPATQSAASEPSSGVDLAYIESLESLQMEGKPDIVLELIKCFKDAVGHKTKVIADAIMTQDSARLSKEAHHFKSTCHGVGAKRLAWLMGQLEEGVDGVRSMGFLERVIEEQRLVEAQLEEVSSKRAARAA